MNNTILENLINESKINKEISPINANTITDCGKEELIGTDAETIIDAVNTEKDITVEETYENFKKDKYPDDNSKKRGEVFRRLQRLKKGTNNHETPEFTEDDDVEYLENVEIDILHKEDMDIRVKSIWNILYLVFVVFENIVTRIGYRIKFNGWAKTMSMREDKYLKYIRGMVEDKIITDPATGKKYIHKNTSYLSKLSFSPSFNLFFLILKDAFEYVSLSGFYKYSKEFMGNEEQLFSNIPVPPQNNK